MTYGNYRAYDLQPPAKARLLRAFTADNYDRLSLVHGCSTGDCTFPEVASGVAHTTSGFCSKCLDLTSWVHEEVRTYNWSEYTSGAYNLSDYRVLTFNWSEYTTQDAFLRLPNGMQVGPIGLFSPDRVFESRLFANFFRNETNAFLIPEIEENPQLSKIWNISAVTAHFLSLTTSDCEVSSRVNPDTEEGIEYDFKCSYPKLAANKSTYQSNVVSASCAIYPCVKDFHAYIRDGRLVEEIVEQTPIYPYDPCGTVYSMAKTPCYLEGQRYDDHNISLVLPDPDLTNLSYYGVHFPPCVYGVPFPLWDAIARERWLPSLIGGHCWLDNWLARDSRTRVSTSCSNEQNVTDAWWLASLYNQGNATFESISKNMEDIATAITDSMRLSTIAEYGWNSNTTISGVVWQSELCMEFRWPWLIFPGAHCTVGRFTRFDFGCEIE